MGRHDDGDTILAQVLHEYLTRVFGPEEVAEVTQ